jgi:hypothetical protein
MLDLHLDFPEFKASGTWIPAFAGMTHKKRASRLFFDY